MNWEEMTALLCGSDWRSNTRGLHRMRKLCGILGDPQKTLRFIHIAGSNGKGSAAAMLSHILSQAGYRTGRYISPHLCRVNERFSVDGTEISDAQLRETSLAVRAATGFMDEKPTIFELITALAFLYFQKEGCDLVVLEVGLGGRLDATNVIDAPIVALIMSLSLEHTAELGDTLEKIAQEKGGIIKEGSEVVLSADPAAEPVIRGLCRERRAGLTITDETELTVTDSGRESLTEQVFSYRQRRDLHLALLGVNQLRNAMTVLDAVDVLRGNRGLVIPEEAVRTGLATVRWPGRFEILSDRPLLIADGAHNPGGVRTLADNLIRYFGNRAAPSSLIFLMGVMTDKQYGEMLDILRNACDPDKNGIEACRFFATAPAGERSLGADRLCAEIERRFECPVTTADSVREGLRQAIAGASDCGAAAPVIIVFGSLYQIGEVMEALKPAADPCGTQNDR